MRICGFVVHTGTEMQNYTELSEISQVYLRAGCNELTTVIFFKEQEHF